MVHPATTPEEAKERIVALHKATKEAVKGKKESATDVIYNFQAGKLSALDTVLQIMGWREE